MKIATFNVAGVRAHLEALTSWLAAAQPDIACLQEIKCVDEAFPRDAIEGLGYNVVTHGQKGFNGVAVLSKLPFDEVRRGLPGDEADEQARYIEAVVSAGSGVLRIGGLYLPNGNPLGTEKFTYKLAWMNRLIAHAKELLALEEPLVLAGDYNVIPMPQDAKNPSAWTGDALFQPESRAAFRQLENLGFTDAIRAIHAGPGPFSFWDYQGGAWQKDHGIRIDHLMLSPEVANRLADAGVDRHVREWEKPSDHVPVWAELKL